MRSLLQNERVVVGVLALLYFFTRLVNLTILPIFTDEAIYIYWSKYIIDTQSHWFIALTDGKPPVLTWIIGIVLTVFPRDWYLIAGRLPSIIFGFLSLLGTYAVAKQLFQSKKISFVAAVFLIFSPFMLVYDRLALYDAQLTAMLVVSVYFCIRTAKTLSIKYALLWGFFLGLAFLSKPPAILYLLITPVCFLVLLPAPRATIKREWRRIALSLFLVGFISEGMNNLQRISGAYAAFQLKNQQFQQPLSELIKNPFSLLPDNLVVFDSWLLSYYTLPLFFFVLVSLFFTATRKVREGLVLFLLWAGPVFAFAIAGREIFPRYLLFITPFAMIAVAYTLMTFWQKSILSRILFGLLTIALLLLPIRFCYLLLTNPKEAPLPTADFNQLVAEHPSGYGLDRVFSYIRSQEKNGKVTVVPQGTFGLYPYAFYLEFWGNPNVRILPKWPLDQLDEEVYQARQDGKVVIVLKEKSGIFPALQDLVLIETIIKPKSIKYPIYLLEVK
ncbi:MAG: glycosyltransferase family 39 protein [Candidatus Levybacteria bacterium]|nr:glycosyltransferase family 39 protein [Candidatus Levybacteria bacterium]